MFCFGRGLWYFGVDLNPDYFNIVVTNLKRIHIRFKDVPKGRLKTCSRCLKEVPLHFLKTFCDLDLMSSKSLKNYRAMRIKLFHTF